MKTKNKINNNINIDNINIDNINIDKLQCQSQNQNLNDYDFLKNNLRKRKNININKLKEGDLIGCMYSDLLTFFGVGINKSIRALN